jgi:toxin YoeB
LVPWTIEAWNDYLFWQAHDMSKCRKINALLKDITRQPFEGLGKPEPLRFELAGYWSRRITGEHRFVYRVTDDAIRVVSCRTHYK